MKSQAPSSKPASIRRRYAYTKVKDNRKHPIRGLWCRNGQFYARITVENDGGQKELAWVPLSANTPAEAQEEFRTVLVERSENRLRHIGRSPSFADYLDETYLPMLAGSGKKPDTITTEKAHYKRWRTALADLRLDKIRPSHILSTLNELRAIRSPRTCNLALVCLRHVLKAARRDNYLKTLPTESIPWQHTETKARRLYSRADVDQFCQAALKASKNGPQFADYVRLLALSGAREQEAIKLRWADVDFERKLLTVGADADTKNREARRIDFNAELGAHLEAMHTRRAPDSKWLFPSPQRGEKDERFKTFREAMKLTRETLPSHAGFGFHDCRHHFISYAVMSGIDFMTIARWVGHKDGGVLIGKVYGHLSNEHAQAQAAKLNFGPVVLQLATAC